MNRLMEQLKNTGNMQELESLEALQKAAKELGFSEDEVAAALEELKNLPLSEDKLLEVAGGYGWVHEDPGKPMKLPFKKVF